MGKAFLIVSGIQQAMDDPESIPETDGGFSLATIPAGVDLFAFLQNMPDAVLNQLRTQMDEGLAALDDDMIIQSAAVPIQAEYTAIGIDTTSIQTNYILRTAGIMLGIALFSGLCTIGVGYFAAKTAAGAARDLRKALFERVESFSNYEFDKFSVSSLITRTTNDITQLQMLIVMVIRIVFFAPILGIGGIIIAMRTAPSMWWTIAVAVVGIVDTHHHDFWYLHCRNSASFRI